MTAPPRTLSGAAALVTGGSRGIGAATALRLAELGADVAITYLAAGDRAEEVAEKARGHGTRALALRADNTDPAAVVAAVDRAAHEFGRLDILVNSAGTFHYGPIDGVTLDEVDNALAVHTRAVYVASQAAIRHMRSGGRIISIGSTLAERVPYPGVALYAMSKAAVIGFTKGLARDMGERGITANVVHPGSTDTEMNPADGAAAADEVALIPLGRYGIASDVADAVAFLAGPGGRHVNGTCLTVDGGANA